MSLGLVAYESSDESDNDDVSPPGTDEIVLPKASLNISSKDSTNFKLKSSNENESSISYVFEDGDVPSKDKALLSLPAPKSKLNELDIDVKKLKNSGTVRISIPSLSQLDSEESTEPPTKKKLKPAQKGSGLFALLPVPKNQGLIPQSISNRTPIPVNKPKPAINSAPATSSVPNRTKKPFLTEYDDSGDEEDAKDKTDFFSLEDDHSPVVPESVIEEQKSLLSEVVEKNNSVLTFSNDVQPTGWSRIKTGESSSSFNEFTPSYPNTQEFMSVGTDDLQLDDEALQQLCGRKDRNKMQGNMQLIDVSGDAIMPDSREWLTKQLTEEQNNIVQSHKRKDGPTSQQRRKHQITYLAFQAKEHELELKNQWANNRVSRKQTQAKYGF